MLMPIFFVSLRGISFSTTLLWLQVQSQHLLDLDSPHFGRFYQQINWNNLERVGHPLKPYEEEVPCKKYGKMLDGPM